MKNILKYGINSNMLKAIAVLAMVIDHIGFYFVSLIPTFVYIMCRYVGRIAMPIFVYMIVQGFFHTKSFKKYVCRMSIFAVVTQIFITILMFLNIKYLPLYTSAKQVYTNGNILFSFVIALCILKLIHEKIIVQKWTYNKNLSLKILLIAVICIATILIPLDYGVEVVILSILMYYVEKFRIQILIEKNKENVSIKNVLLNSLSDAKIKSIYLSLILIILSTLILAII